MRRALFVCSVYQFSRETFPVLEALAREGFDVHVLVGWSGETSEEYAERCRSAGFAVHRPPARLRYGDPHADAAAPDDDAGRWHVSSHERRFSPPLAISREVKRFARRLLAEVEPSLVLGGPYVSCGTFDQGIARAAGRRRVPYCCLSVSPYLGERNCVHARFSFLSRGLIPEAWHTDRSLLTRAVARLFPGWSRTQDGVGLFPWNPVSMLAARLTGLLDPNPWQQPSDLYDVCFVESDFSRDMLVGSGYPPEKVVVAGKPLLDEVFAGVGDRGWVERLYRSLRLEPGAPYLLCNVEPGHEHRYVEWDEHWQRFRTVMGALARIGADVVLSLHPLCEPSHYRFVEDEYGFRLCEDYKITELYPFCSVSVSFPCSTNLLAPVFRKPLVVYDFLGETREDSPRAPLYRLPGAWFAYDGEELERAVRQALEQAEPPGAATSPEAAGGASERIARHVVERFGL